ncbi:hypothetical protein GS462_11205 [Rhodococcus hoagii]|nr:hypothetical protein [Prescottella equi]MBM4650979.1 hypothetical protein [Prescottella equi]MBM4686674.1 hypothetical protein [Prescottella equi]
MPGITGMVTTYDCPNFVGELFGLSREDTPFLSAIGGLTGGENTGSTIFNWQSYDLRDGEDDRQRAEGDDAPNPEGRKRVNGHNVLEIHQEAVAVSYTKLGAVRQVAGSNPMQSGTQPVTDELTWQIAQEIKQVARDVNKSFITGTYHLPEDDTTVRRTRGILQATTTNVVTNATPADLTEEMILDVMQLAWENGGLRESETRTILTGARQKRRLTKAFITDKGYKEQTRNVGGVNLQTIETDFGRCNIMLEPDMPNDQLEFVSLEECAPRFLEIPGKGHFFLESLAKTGSSEKAQIYGEIGLKYGNERKHAKLTGLK